MKIKVNNSSSEFIPTVRVYSGNAIMTRTKGKYIIGNFWQLRFDAR